MSERFVDEAVKPIPPMDTWDTMSINDLIDVKIQLEDKLFTFASNPAIAAPLKRSIAKLEKMILNPEPGE